MVRRLPLKKIVGRITEISVVFFISQSVVPLSFLMYHYRMTTYVALLRGIMPTNPNMRNEKLRGVFKALGFTNVQTVISSGNIIFESDLENAAELEQMIESELMKRLGIKCPAYIRSKKQLESLIRKDPFKGAEHASTSYLIVSFRKNAPREIYNVIDTTGPTGQKFMSAIEKKYGKDITTRTWKTVERIVKKMP